ncbi:hypothetical protein [Tumidithrix helvetica]|uniref:hypothetical protein n=1 Tax=Tumidithrix helvetica TaxID=3457545 RepID=UPI003CC694CE
MEAKCYLQSQSLTLAAQLHRWVSKNILTTVPQIHDHYEPTNTESQIPSGHV